MWCQFKLIYGTQVREFQRGANLPTHISLELNIVFKTNNKFRCKSKSISFLEMLKLRS